MSLRIPLFNKRRRLLEVGGIDRKINYSIRKELKKGVRRNQ